MRLDKHMEILKEVDETVSEALKSRDILTHQRRLISMLSIGAQQLLEAYFHRLNVIKPGTQVKHEWFGMGERNLDDKLASILTTKTGKIPRLGEVLVFARRIESGRNELIYGSPAVDGRLLREKIDAYLEMKRLTGVVDGHKSRA